MNQQYEPIYNSECSICSSGPVVGIRSPAGHLVATEICGPHFFGDRIFWDPEEWNKRPESTE